MHFPASDLAEARATSSSPALSSTVLMAWANIVVQLRQLPQLSAARLLGQRGAVAVVVEARQPVVDHPSPHLAQSFRKHPKYFRMKKYLFNYLVLVVASAARLAGVAVFERPGHDLGDCLLHQVTGHGGERRLSLSSSVV